MSVCALFMYNKPKLERCHLTHHQPTKFTIQYFESISVCPKICNTYTNRNSISLSNIVSDTLDKNHSWCPQQYYISWSVVTKWVMTVMTGLAKSACGIGTKAICSEASPWTHTTPPRQANTHYHSELTWGMYLSSVMANLTYEATYRKSSHFNLPPTDTNREIIRVSQHKIRITMPV